MSIQTVRALVSTNKLPPYIPCNNGFYILGGGNDAKTRKGEKVGYLTGVLYMSPATKIGRLVTQWEAGINAPAWYNDYRKAPNFNRLFKANMCAQASEGCTAACLDTAGHGGFSPSVPIGRGRKTILWNLYRDGFTELLRMDVAKLEQRALARGLKPQIRLNGTTDVRWERYLPIRQIMIDFPDVDFYDYTKYKLSARSYGRPTNYKLTFSLSEKETSWGWALQYLKAGRPVAVVFKSKADVKTVLDRGTWRGIPVVDGDEHDVRFYDGAVITALAPKGVARNGTGGNFLQSAE